MLHKDIQFNTSRKLSNIIAWANANDRQVIILLTCVTALIWFLAEPIIFTGDSFAYLNSAKALAGLEKGSFVYFRAPFLPLLLAATKVPIAQTFSGFILIQLLLGIVSTLILHDCLRRISRPLGLASSLIFISTFIAFVHSKAVMTEEIYLFGWCLCINGVLAYLTTPGRLRLLQVVIALLIIMMTRAQGVFIAFIVLPYLIICLPRRTLEILLSAVILVLSVFACSQYYASKAKLIEDQQTRASIAGFGVTHTTGKMLFVTIYWDPFRRMNWTLVHPENGPASKRLFAELKEYYSKPSNLSHDMDQALFGRFVGNPEGLIQNMESMPDGQYWWTIWQAMDKHLGASLADQLLMRATFETILAHPLKVAYIYLRNFGVALVKADSSYVWAHPLVGFQDLGQLLGSELIKSGDCTKHNNLALFLNFYFPSLQLLLLIIALGWSKMLWNSRWRASWLFCVILLIYNHVTIAIAASPESRYTFYVFPLLLVIVTMGLSCIVTKWQSQK